MNPSAKSTFETNPGVVNFIDIRIESDEPHNWDTAVYTVAADSRHKQRVSHSAEARPHSEKSSGNADANGLDSAEVPHSRLLPDRSHFCLASEYAGQDNRAISYTKPSDRYSTNALLDSGPLAFAMSFHPAADSEKADYATSRALHKSAYVPPVFLWPTKVCNSSISRICKGFSAGVGAAGN